MKLLKKIFRLLFSKKTLYFWFPVLLFVYVVFMIILDYFGNIENDTTTLTNFGFAILGGISSITFSWQKTLDKEDDSTLINELQRYGELALYAAILFLIASSLKYGAIATSNNQVFKPFINKYILIGGASVCFMYAASISVLVITKLMERLFDRTKFF